MKTIVYYYSDYTRQRLKEVQQIWYWTLMLFAILKWQTIFVARGSQWFQRMLRKNSYQPKRKIHSLFMFSRSWEIILEYQMSFSLAEFQEYTLSPRRGPITIVWVSFPLHPVSQLSLPPRITTILKQHTSARLNYLGFEGEAFLLKGGNSIPATQRGLCRNSVRTDG